MRHDLLQEKHRRSSVWAVILRMLPIVCAPLLAGCASFSPDGGMDAVRAIARTELNKDAVALRTADDVAGARAKTERLLKRPLTAATAVQIALLNNRDLQRAFASLRQLRDGKRRSVYLWPIADDLQFGRQHRQHGRRHVPPEPPDPLAQ